LFEGCVICLHMSVCFSLSFANVLETQLGGNFWIEVECEALAVRTSSILQYFV